MRRWLPYPLMWVVLTATWLVLNETVAPAHVLLGAAVALAAVHALRALQLMHTRVRHPLRIVRLLWLVLLDVVRSNVAVGRIVLHRGTRRQRSGFLHIPLETRHPATLAALACIITSTPGTSWARYDSQRGVLVMHILDLIDEEEWIRTIKERYERRLMEIFE